MADRTTFNSYGIVVSSPSGDVTINAGQNMTLLPQGNFVTLSAEFPKAITSINGLSGAVNIIAGDGITIDITGNNLTIQTGNTYVTESGFNLYTTEDGSGNYIVE